MKTIPTRPRDLLVDQTAMLAARIVHRIVQRNARPDEYAQLAPYVDKLFRRTGKKAK